MYEYVLHLSVHSCSYMYEYFSHGYPDADRISPLFKFSLMCLPWMMLSRFDPSAVSQVVTKCVVSATSELGDLGGLS